VQIINIHTRTMVQHKKMAKDVDLELLAKVTKGFSGADIQNLVNTAAIHAAAEGVRDVLHIH